MAIVQDVSWQGKRWGFQRIASNSHTAISGNGCVQCWGFGVAGAGQGQGHRRDAYLADMHALHICSPV